MSHNNSEMSGQVSIPLDRIPGPEVCNARITLASNYTDDLVQEADNISQDFGSSTQNLSRPSTQDSKSPPSKTLRASEPPKKVCKPGTLLVLAHLALFHLPSVAITLTLVALYSVNLRWVDLSDEQLGYLQFVAKGHETLIILSLADILMHRVRYTLLQDRNGVPLGFLSSSFIIGSPISYFFSSELWTPLLRPRAKAQRISICIQLTGILIIICIIISAAAAPLSAIAIIPRSKLWHIRAPKEAEGRIHFLIGPLWETNPRPSGMYDWTNSMDDALYGLKSLLEDARMNHTQQITNVSFVQGERTISNALLEVYGPEGEEQSLAVATTPMAALQSRKGNWEDKPKNVLTKTWQKVLGDRFGSGWDTRVNLTAEEKLKEFRRVPTSRWKQPIVAVECSVNETTMDTATFMFNSNITNNKLILNAEDNDDFRAFLKNAIEGNGTLPKPSGQQRNSTLDVSPVHTRFLGLPGNRTSAAILFSRWAGPDDDRAEASLCRIYSRWVEADTWLEHGESVYQTQLDAPLLDIEAHFGSSIGSEDFNNMSKDWLNVTSNGELHTQDSPYEIIYRFCRTREYNACLAVSLATHMAYILSSTYSDSYGIQSPTSYEREPTTGDAVILLEYFIGGYGYDWKSSRTIPFAFSVLLFHVLIVFIHTTIVLWSRHPWHSSSWGSFGQMIVLALRSRALDGLGSVGAGVSSSQTWSTSVSVRVVDGDDRLEMVLQNEKGHSQYQKVAGEAEEEGADRGPSLVQPGVKYH
jgi:hypothetical protein